MIPASRPDRAPRAPEIRRGHGHLSAPEPEATRQVATPGALAAVPAAVPGEPPAWNHPAGSGLIALGASPIVRPRS